MEDRPERLSRRGFIGRCAAGVAAISAGLPAIASAARTTAQKETRMPEIMKIEAKPLPEKIFKTEAVGISRKTHEEHYKLYQGYVNKTNEIREKLATVDHEKANQVFSDLRSLKTDYSFAIGGIRNHEVYFDNLGGSGGPANGEVATLITKHFGSFDAWAKDFKFTGMAARGWAWLAYDREENSLFNFLGDAQNTFPIWNAAPILALDTYEHAYYLDFQTARAKYIDAFLQVVDWDSVNRLLAKATKF